ncbi:unnamed protein product [Larinioides sclopetarius]|uniref:Uncharacterized protein n=1 Tax=Larinioides sclopetarius TaxID=280406 RepID=A0AAV2A2S9_9ARAC
MASKNMKESKNTGCCAVLKISNQRNLNFLSKILKCSRRKGNQSTAIARRKSIYCRRKSQFGGQPIK